MTEKNVGVESSLESPYGKLDWLDSRWRGDHHRPERILHSDDIEPHNKYRISWMTGVATVFENALLNPNLDAHARKIAEDFLTEYSANPSINSQEHLTTPDEINRASMAIREFLKTNPKKDELDAFHLAFLVSQYDQDSLRRRSLKTRVRRLNAFQVGITIDIENLLNSKVLDPEGEQIASEYLKEYENETHEFDFTDPNSPESRQVIAHAKETAIRILNHLNK